MLQDVPEPDILLRDQGLLENVTEVCNTHDLSVRSDASVYLAGPYQDHMNTKDVDIKERRFRFYTRIAARLMESRLDVFSPVTHSHEIAKQICNTPSYPHNFWLARDLNWLLGADVVLVVKAHGWLQSRGVHAEVKAAQEANIPVKTIDPLHFMHIVAFGGKKRSGKDTACRLVHEFKDEISGAKRPIETVQTFAFADRLKEAMAVMYGYNERQLDGDLKEVVDPRTGETPRQGLQQLGTDIIRNQYDGEVWLNATFRDMRYYLPDLALVSDLRFPNELHSINRFASASTYLLKRDVIENDDDHSSETALEGCESDFDGVISNNQTIDDLADSITSSVRFRGDEYPNQLPF